MLGFRVFSGIANLIRRLHWTRRDLLLLSLGPAGLLLLYLFLPQPQNEGERGPDERPTGVVAQVVGYTVSGRGPRAWMAGTGQTSDLRLLGRSAPREAALLFLTDSVWRIASAGPDAAPSLLNQPDSATSTAPWRRFRRMKVFLSGYGGDDVRVTGGAGTVRVTRVRVPVVELGGKDGAAVEAAWIDPERPQLVEARQSGVVALACPESSGPPRVFWTGRSRVAAGDDPAALCAAAPPGGWTEARACGAPRGGACVHREERWRAQVRQGNGGPTHFLNARGEPLLLPGLWVALRGLASDSIRIGVRPPQCQPGQLCLPPRWIVHREDGDSTVIGPVRLRTGDVLSLGQHAYLVRTRAPGRGEAGLDLLQVRRRGAPSVFRSSSGAESYHPLGVWNVPDCQVVQGGLGVVIRHPPRGGAPAREDDLLVSEPLPAASARRIREVEGMPADTAGSETLGLCHVAAAGGLRLRVDAGGARGVTVQRDTLSREPVRGRTEVQLGEPGAPREVLVAAGGLLLRVAPASAARVQRSVRRGTALYLALLLLAQALPLTYARARRRAALEARRRAAHGMRRPWDNELVAPAELGAATLLQLVAIGIAWLLLVGAAFQALLSSHPQLAGVPDYGQAFLQAVVLTGMVLTSACWFCFGGASLPRRLGFAALGAALALVLAYGWWRLDAAAVPPGLWLSALRATASGFTESAGEARSWLYLAALAAGAGILLVGVSFTRRGVAVGDRLAAGTTRAVRHPLLVAVAFLLAGLFVGLVAVQAFARKSALAVEISLLFALAWYGAVHWDYGRTTALPGVDETRRERREVMWLALAAIGSILLFLFVGARLSTPVSFTLFTAGGVAFIYAIIQIRRAREQTLARLVWVWLGVSVVGGGIALLLMSDMGSVAAWVPAVMAGFYLWAVRPEEVGERAAGACSARLRLVLSGATACLLLGMLDVLDWGLLRMPGDSFERPRQRFALVQDVAYPIGGEWVTQVRWLASEPGTGFRWVPNLNSDVAVFGIASNFGLAWALLASAFPLALGLVLAFAADQALREGRLVQDDLVDGRLRRVPRGVAADDWRLVPSVSLRALGLALGMLACLLLAQWLVHLATGVSQHLPLTGLVLPWVSHGTTTHLLYAAALALPLAVLVALGELTPTLVERTR